MHTPSFRSPSRVLVGLVAGFLIVPVLATSAVSAPSAAPAPPSSSACTGVSPGAVAGFFDEAVPGGLAKAHVPGAVVSVVSGGTTVFAKGYGLADVAHKVPITPERSLVRLGSVTKLFTWTAVMQQVEAGRLDLNTDINRYLKAFKVPATYPEPITLQTLMDHTSGFEDRAVGTGARSSAEVPALGTYLAANMPARIRPPGEVSAYSNYGAALAGYIVTQVSGKSYDRYIQDHLLDPLGMAHTTATEPVPAALATDLANSYDTDTSTPQRIPFAFDPSAPDGSMSATADDMTNFMIAQLHEGRFGNAAILSPATVAQMHERSFTADPRLDGYAHGFKERTINGHRMLLHDGAWEGFVNELVLVPGCDLGLFVSANSASADTALVDVIDAFFDRFAPAGPTATTVGSQPTASRTIAAAVQAGFYQPTRHNESTAEKVTLLVGQFRLTLNDDGTLHFKGKKWMPQGNDLYRTADDSDHLTFRTGTDGKRYLATDSSAYQLMPASGALLVNLLALIAILVLALSAVAVPLAGAGRRIFHRSAPTAGTWRAARRLAAAAAGLGLVFVISLAGVLLGDSSSFLYGYPLTFRLLLLVPIVALLTAVAAVACTVKGWRGSGAGVVVRIHQVALLTGVVVLAWFLWQWNLIGWQLG
jgi:CubicO group peptidase (beta-lactamase class C family)